MSLVADKITQLCSWGTSRAVRIPKDLCERLGVDVGARLSMHVVHDEEARFCSFGRRVPSIAVVSTSRMFR